MRDGVQEIHAPGSRWLTYGDDDEFVSVRARGVRSNLKLSSGRGTKKFRPSTSMSYARCSSRSEIG
jgi:hypothetical protein